MCGECGLCMIDPSLETDMLSAAWYLVASRIRSACVKSTLSTWRHQQTQRRAETKMPLRQHKMPFWMLLGATGNSGNGSSMPATWA